MKLILLLIVCASSSYGDSIIFDLASYDPKNETTHVYKEFSNLTEGMTKVLVVNVPENYGFFVIQVHTFVKNITLASTTEFDTQTFIKGSNVGLVGLNQTQFFIFSDNSTTALVVLMVYESGDPVPGGCNLSLPTEIAPYQLISNTEDLIVVYSQAPFASGTKCERNNIDIEMYHLYLPENDFDPAHYFNGIEKMLTVQEIRANGYRVDVSDGYFKYRKLYSLYRGVGQVFAIVATFKGRSSAYVPAVSYGCDLSDEAESCNGPATIQGKFLCAILLIFGVFVCFVGHKFFRTTLYLIGFVFGIFITYAILSFSVDLAISEKSTTSILIGLVYGAVWLLVWWKFGLPILSISSTFLLSGFLFSSMIFYTGAADVSIFRNNVNFWLIQCSIILVFCFILGTFALQAHIFVTSFLGAYACITALNFYIGGNLQYIIINAYRRIAVDNFNMATVDPPFQVLDICHAIFWFALVVVGFFIQLKEQKGKPPFPPARYLIISLGDSETTPFARRESISYNAI